jgi:hypothetical protein
MPPSRLLPLLTALCLLAIGGPLLAQLPLVRLDQVFPMGGAAGAAVDVEIGGKDLDVETLHFDHPGFQVKRLQPNRFRISVAADVPAKSYELRAVGKHGISNARLFAVSRGMTEVLEKEPNDTPDKAQAVPVNAVIHGTCDGNADDYFRLPLKKGERVVIDCQGFRLDSNLRAVLVICSADGKELAHSRPYHERTDPLLVFTAPAQGDYVLGLHDSTYSGGLPYRLTISNRPYIESVFPCAVVGGQKTELVVSGWNLPGGKPSPNNTLLDHPLETVTVSWTAPSDPVARQRYELLEHPSAASSIFRGMQVSLPGLENAIHPAILAFADAPVVAEQEPNNSRDKAQAVKLPAVVCGRLDRPGDVDWYTFTAKAGEAIRIDLLCERLGRPGDPFVIVTDDKGNEVASLDDHGINTDALAQFNRDPLGAFTAPANGKYWLMVQDRYQAGGPRFSYVLSLTRPTPDFYPVAFHESNPDPSCPLVRQGGSAFCEVCLNRQGFGGPVTLEAEGLPAGVSCPPVQVSGQTEMAPVVFTAAATAPAWSGPIRLKAWATIDGKRVEREVRWAERRRQDNNGAMRLCRQLCLAVRPGAAYAIGTPAAPVTVTAGQSVTFQAALERRAADFKGKVQLVGLMLPPGFECPATAVEEGQKTAAVKLTVAEGVPAGSYTVVLRGDAQVPFRPDPKAAAMNVRVADPSTPLTVVVRPPAKK